MNNSTRDEQELQQAAGGRAILLWVLARLASNFGASFPDKPSMKAKLQDWREMVEAHPWITEDVLYKAVPMIRFHHKGPFVPGLAEFLDYCHAALNQVRRETEKALPPPPLPPGPDDPGQISAKEQARAYLRARGLSSGEARPPGRGRAGPSPLTQDEIAAAYERRGLERER